MPLQASEYHSIEGDKWTCKGDANQVYSSMICLLQSFPSYTIKTENDDNPHTGCYHTEAYSFSCMRFVWMPTRGCICLEWNIVDAIKFDCSLVCKLR